MAPSKKGGGKGRKKSLLTDEEKEAKAQEKAKLEKEKIRHRKTLTKSFLKVKREKEYELIKLSESQLMDIWRPRLRKQKIKELMDDYKLMQNAFERSFEKKSELIKELEDTLENNDLEYNNALDMHMCNIDKMLAFYKTRLADVKESYAAEKETLIDSLNWEKSQIHKHHDISTNYLNVVMSAVQRRYEDTAADSLSELMVREEELRNKCLEESQTIKEEIEKKLDEVCEDLKRRLIIYDGNVAPVRNEFFELRKKDDVTSNLIDTQYTKLYTLQDGMRSIDEKSIVFAKAVDKLFEELRKKKTEYRDTYAEQAKRHRFFTAKSVKSIRHLALTTHNTTEKLQCYENQRVRLMNCIERCRKQERLDEKVDPFMIRWSLGDLLESPKESDPASTVFQPGDEEEAREMQFVIRVADIVHNLSCDCNPCTCEIKEEKKTGLNESINKLTFRGFQPESKKLKGKEDPASRVFQPGEEEFVIRVADIVHNLSCDCNPCTCEIKGENETGLNAPINKLTSRGVQPESKKLKGERDPASRGFQPGGEEAREMQFVIRVADIVHNLSCDCNPCTCEIEGEKKTGLNAPINKVKAKSKKLKGNSQRADEEEVREMPFVIHVPDVVHNLSCDCNPCTCEITGEIETGLNAPINKLVNDYSLMERFWLRFNRVSLERAALSLRKQAFKNDNYELRLTLRNYLGGLNPFDHKDVYTFSNKLLEKDKKVVQYSVRMMQQEWKRRERSRKVGGLRMF